MDMNKFAKDNDLARKFEAAINLLDIGKGWEVFKGLDKGETQVKVTYDGEVMFHPVKKPKRRVKKEKPTPPEPPREDTPIEDPEH